MAQKTAIGKKIAASTIAPPLEERARRKIAEDIFYKLLDTGSENEADNDGYSDQDRNLNQLHASARFFQNLFHTTSFHYAPLYR